MLLHRYSQNINRFPLPEEFFKRVQLQPAQHQELERKANDLVRRALDLEPLSGNALLKWKRVNEISGLEVYRGDCRSQVRDKYFKGIVSIPGHIHEAIDIIRTTSTAKYQYVMTQLYDATCLDAKVLHVVKISDHQHITLKYLILDLPSSSNQPRDFCFLEATGVHMQDDGTELVYSVMESIEIPECPTLPSCFGVTRGVFTSTGMILRPESSSDSFRICYSGAIDLCMGNEPRPMFGSKPRYLLLHGLTRVLALIETRRVEGKTLQNGAATSKAHAQNSRACALCYRNFHAFRSRRICRGCGDAMCSKCCPKRTFRAESSGGDEVTTRLCVRCVLEARKSDRSSIDSVSEAYRSSSSDIRRASCDSIQRRSAAPASSPPAQKTAAAAASTAVGSEYEDLAKRFLEISERSKETLSMVRHNTRVAMQRDTRIKQLSDSGDEIEPEPSYFK